MNKEKFNEIFQEAIEGYYDICVEVSVPNQLGNEFILNRWESLENKLEYYNQAYNDNLVHYNNPEIVIWNVYPVKFENLQNQLSVESCLREKNIID